MRVRAEFLLGLSMLSAGCSSDRDTAVKNAPAPDCASESFQQQIIDVGETSLNVGCQGSGTTIVALHGYPEAHFSWSRFASALAPDGYRVVAPDLRGYGLSDRPDGVPAYQVEHLVTDLKGILDVACTERCLVVGHDWGGTLAYILAHRFPDKVRGIVVISGAHPDVWGHPDVDPVQAQAQAAYVPILVSANGEALFSSYDALFTPHVSADELTLYHEAWERPGAKVAMNNWYRANLDPVVTMPTDVTVDVPTLVLWGKKDPFATASQLPLLSRWVSDLRIQEFADGDHFFYLSETEAVKRAVEAFERERSLR